MIKEDHRSLIKTVFNTYNTLSEEALDFLDSSYLLKEYKAHDFILEAGRTEKHFYIVVSGVAMIYLINRNGERVVLGFSFEGNFSGVYDSFLKQTPSVLFLETLSPMKALAFSKETYFEFFEKFPEMMKWRALFFEGILLGRLSREAELLTQSAEQRFLSFMERCPEPLLQIPQKYLASYLNMTPETFSRMRSKKR
ncbi:MAG: Crp/Fnr family transcriptional regulator [Cyclobacteriaceae bacterium]